LVRYCSLCRAFQKWTEAELLVWWLLILTKVYNSCGAVYQHLNETSLWNSFDLYGGDSIRFSKGVWQRNYSKKYITAAFLSTNPRLVSHFLKCYREKQLWSLSDYKVKWHKFYPSMGECQRICSFLLFSK
jgi:hypothetical protein